jgi:hypothetical protein
MLRMLRGHLEEARGGGAGTARQWFRRAVQALDVNANNATCVDIDLEQRTGSENNDMAAVQLPNDEWFWLAAGAGVQREAARNLPPRRVGLDNNGDNDNNDNDNSSTPSDEDLDRLFGSVLPHHPTLVEIVIRNALLPPSRIDAFFGAMATRTEPSPLQKLEFSGTVLDNNTAPAAIARMLRNKACVPHLRDLRFTGTRLDGDALKQICDCFPDRSSLRCFHFTASVEAVVTSDTLVGALGPASSLETLKVCARWTHEGLVSAVQALRTNETLQDIELLRVLEGRNELVRDEFCKLLSRYNFTLRRTSLFFGQEVEHEAAIRAMVEQNRPIQRVHEHLKLMGYQFELYKLWPAVMGSMSRFPTLLYRFLRRGNVVGLASVLSGTADLSLPIGVAIRPDPATCEIL